MLLILKQPDIKVHLLFKSAIFIYICISFFNSGRETLTPGRDQRTPTFPAQVDKNIFLTFLSHLTEFICLLATNNFLSFIHRAIEASEDLRWSTYIWRPQCSCPEVCHWNSPQPRNQAESHRSWWVTVLLRQPPAGIITKMLKDFSNPPNSLFILYIFQLKRLTDGAYFSEINIYLAEFSHNKLRHFVVWQLLAAGAMCSWHNFIWAIT